MKFGIRRGWRETFERANTLWFVEGRSARAVDLYRSAARQAPRELVVRFQLARALWAVGRGGEAEAELDVVEAGRNRLSELGRSMLDEFVAQLRNPRAPLAEPSEPLDADLLQEVRLPAEGWGALARAARSRRMPGVAAYASSRATGSTGESTRDLEAGREAAIRELSYLAAMLPDRNRNQNRNRDQGQGQGQGQGEGRPEPGPRRTTSGAPSEDSPQARPPSPPPEPGTRMACPLVVTAATSSVLPDQDTVLRITVTNTGSEPVLVNGRMLLNTPDAPPGFGELWLSVDGPPGYHNRSRFFVRASDPPPQSFVVLEPAGSISADYPLLTYESLHLPGRYRLGVVYRNATSLRARGLDACTGSVGSERVTLIRP
ncbi:hypothetical protein Snoj_42920 [Streptomyces nojiriensis]|uniref:Tetratricopeptide repeat protein n=1 Tax=Streptomyces nojiriensis TaxID=66374 RepID=A0ABQ3SQF6_9ACTN|nr:tetratricopeptide repeat protein [Streptomyces nojiriensis]QTI43907.1 hypothetical protein JYK04_01670 [Streptomyces nojiriensis]GGR84743.1 hypothetical protein GCM10010205_11580 [Streptomyces nojiriensis]GHI70374.1 hypothetical protein Snoj_42920 [Streptomyces nojiriensis]